MLHLRLALSLLFFTSLYMYASGTVVLKPILKNAEGVPSADLEAIIQDVNKINSGDLDELAERVRFAFQKHGYYKVQVADPIMPTAEEIDDKKIIPVNLVVTTGEKYRIREIGFSSSSVFSPRVAYPVNVASG